MDRNLKKGAVGLFTLNLFQFQIVILDIAEFINNID